MSKKPIRRRQRTNIVESQPEETITPPEPTQPKRREKKHSLDGDSLLAELASFEMDSLLTGTPIKQVYVGDTVTGMITRADAELIFVDIGSKSEAMMHTSAEEDLTVGQEITATVIRTGSKGIIIAQRLQQSTDIEAYQNAYEHHIPVKGTIIETNQGGYKVSLGSITGFCPRSQIDIHPKEPESYLNESFEFEITELKSTEVILSRRRILQRERDQQKETLLASINIGDQHTGRVVRLTSFGAFVDLGGIDGLIGQRTLKKFAVELQEGDEILVSIDNVNGDKISLSVPQHDPWLQLGSQYQIGQVYPAKISKRLDFGIFVQLAPGLDGLVHKSNLSDNPNENPQQFKQVGETVQVRILSFDLENRRIALGIRQALEDDVAYTPTPTAPPSKKATFGSVFADVFSQLTDD